MTSNSGSTALAASLLPALQSVGTGTVDCQTRFEIEPRSEKVEPLRSASDRRHRLRPAKPRGNGSPVYVTGRPLRTGQRGADQQSSVQQMGVDFQRSHDNCRRDRPPSSPQRDSGVEHGQLPFRDGQTDEGIKGHHRDVKLLIGGVFIRLPTAARRKTPPIRQQHEKTSGTFNCR